MAGIEKLMRILAMREIMVRRGIANDLALEVAFSTERLFENCRHLLKVAQRQPIGSDHG